MPQKKIWEREYRNPRLVSGASAPSQDIKNFARFLRRKKGMIFEEARVLDLGSGVGKHAEFFAEQGAVVTGFEIAENAFKEAVRRSSEAGLLIEYRRHDIGTQYPILDRSIDIAFDVMSTNSLSEVEREVHLKETVRALKDGGWFFVKCLAKDGDRNAQTLLKEHPGKEKDTYIIPQWGLTERVFSKIDLENLYSRYFRIEMLERKTNYPQFDGRIYKRNYWIVYLQKVAPRESVDG